MENQGLTVEASAPSTLVQLTSDIVSAYVSNHVVPQGDLASLITQTYQALANQSPGAPAVAEASKPTPAVPVKKSIHNDYIVCLEDGGKFKSLKRHLSSKYGMTPDEYRAKWGLPDDYPMVAPAYARQRSALAKQMGLGLNRAA
jgi:predicted transcriptional regulator